MYSSRLNVATSLKNKRGVETVVENFFKDYYQPIDEEIFVAMVNSFNNNIDEAFKPQFLKDKLSEYGSVEKWKDNLFSNSLFINKEKVLTLKEKDLDVVLKDPAYEMFEAFQSWYNETLRPTINRLNSEIRVAYRDYMQGQMDFEKNKQFYPDANLTLRVAYGNIKG